MFAMRVLWKVAVGMVAVVLAAPGALAVVHEAPDGYGDTNVTTTPTCSALVSGDPFPPFLVVDINGLDDVHFEYHVSWNDDRSSGLSARHYFLMTVSYSKASGDQTVDLEKNTPGDADGSTTLELTVENVEKGEEITVTWSAEVSIPGVCSDGDSDGGTLFLM